MSFGMSNQGGSTLYARIDNSFGLLLITIFISALTKKFSPAILSDTTFHSIWIEGLRPKTVNFTPASCPDHAGKQDEGVVIIDHIYDKIYTKSVSNLKRKIVEIGYKNGDFCILSDVRNVEF
jgi:hypothetical protein